MGKAVQNRAEHKYFRMIHAALRPAVGQQWARIDSIRSVTGTVCLFFCAVGPASLVQPALSGRPPFNCPCLMVMHDT